MITILCSVSVDLSRDTSLDFPWQCAPSAKCLDLIARESFAALNHPLSLIQVYVIAMLFVNGTLINTFPF